MDKYIDIPINKYDVGFVTFDLWRWTCDLGRWMFDVASGGPCGVPGIQAGSSPFVAQARQGLGGENCPVVSHHGYVRARRTSPAWPLVSGDRGASRETAPTGVERELKSTSTCLWPAPKWWVGPAWRVSEVGSPRPPAFFRGGRCAFEFAPRTVPSVVLAIAAEIVRFGGSKKKKRISSPL